MKKNSLIPLLILVFVVILSSCQKEEQYQIEGSEEPLDKAFYNPESVTILGKQLENPYSVDNMTKALEKLKANNKLKSASTEGIEIETTHLYVRFLPKSEQELDILKQDTLLDIYDYPLDYEIISEGVSYHDPSLPDTVITWQYTVVSPEYQFPEITYETLAELFIMEEDEDSIITKSASVNYFDWVLLENKALELTGNLNEESNTTLTLKANKWRPAGRITANGNPVVGCMVRARRWFTTHKGYTNNNGDFSCDGRLRRDANYSIKWERYHWDIRDGNFGQAYYNGPKQRGNWNLNITGGKSLRYAFIHQAAYDYYYRNPFGTQHPPHNKWYRSAIKIGYHDKDGGSLGDYAKWRNWLSWPHIRIYRSVNGTNRTTTQIYATTAHELGHAAHWQLIVSASGSNRNRDFNFAETKMVESWARGIQWEFTKHFIDSNYPFPIGPLPNYTDIVRTLRNLGYSLRELEQALIGASKMEEWRDNIINKYDKSYENQVDDIFASY